MSINNRPGEARPHGVVLILENADRPGMVGRIGTLLGGSFAVEVVTAPPFSHGQSQQWPDRDDVPSERVGLGWISIR